MKTIRFSILTQEEIQRYYDIINNLKEEWRSNLHTPRFKDWAKVEYNITLHLRADSYGRYTGITLDEDVEILLLLKYGLTQPF